MQVMFHPRFGRGKFDNPILAWIENAYNEIDIFRRHLTRFIPRLLSWVVFLWGDEDWEGHDLIRVMVFKMKRLEKYFKATNIGYRKRSDGINKEIRLAYKALERCIRWEGEYTRKEEAEHDKKYGKLKMIEEMPDPKTGCIPVTFEPKKGSALRRRIHLLGLKRQQADIDLAFKIIADKFQGWWD